MDGPVITTGQARDVLERAPRVSVRNLSKRFGGVQALADVSLDLWPGTVHAVLGENGAGKSTLVKILSGAIRPDAGVMLVGGVDVQMASPRDARRLGISVVYQELNLFPTMTVVDNIYAGTELHGPLGLMHRDDMVRALRTTMEAVGFHIPPDREVAQLSLAERQMVEILRAFHFQADMILLDEPNSALTDAETEALYAVVRRFRSRGQSFLLVSHRIDEVLGIADFVTILRDGHVVTSLPAERLTVRDAVRLMVGWTGRAAPSRHERASSLGEIRLSIGGLRAGKLEGFDLEVRKGEIVGVTGLEGSGVEDLFDALFGLRRHLGGTVMLDGVPYQPDRPGAAVRAGVASIPADRRRDALMMDRSVAENIVVVILDRLRARLGYVPEGTLKEVATGFSRRFRIRARSLDAPVTQLSGGNQQKVVLAKWLAAKPRLMLLNDPTRGVDVGAKVEVHDVVRELAAQGMSILVWSSESEELLELCDRILVFRKGRLISELDPTTTSRRELLLAVMGES